MKYLVLLCLLLLSGCCGIGVVSFKSSETKLNTDLITKEQLLDKRGTPDKIISISNTEEDIIYNNGVGWSGVVPFIAIGLPIPIPFLVPAHMKYVKYHIDNNYIQNVTMNNTKTSECFIGYLAGIEGAGTGNWSSGCD